MNIFYLDKDVKVCARYHNDKHVVKMILECAQLLSTAHRVLDGKHYIDSSSGRRIQRWKLSTNDKFLYKATHVNHPSAIWARQSAENYIWLASLMEALCAEYGHRYHKVHACENSGLGQWLRDHVPKNISDAEFTEPTPCMPEEYIVKNDSVASYRAYYLGSKQNMARLEESKYTILVGVCLNIT